MPRIELWGLGVLINILVTLVSLLLGAEAWRQTGETDFFFSISICVLNVESYLCITIKETSKGSEAQNF